MAPFGFFGFLSSLSTGSSVGGCPTSAVTRELRNFRNVALFIPYVFPREYVPVSAEHSCQSWRGWRAVTAHARPTRGYCACAADAWVLRMRSQCGSNVWTAVVITMNILTCLIFSDQIFREGRRWWGSENAWNVEKIPNDDENSCAKNLWKMRETCKDEKESDEASWAVPWTRSAVNVISVFWRERIHQTLCSLPWTGNCMKCEKYLLTKRNYIRHHGVYHGAKCS